MSCEHAGWHGAHPQLARTEEARASNPLTSTPNLAGQSVAEPPSAALSSSPEAPGATLGPRPGRRGKGADRLQVDVWTTNERLQHYDLRQGFSHVRTVVLPHTPPGRCSSGQPSVYRHPAWRRLRA